MTMWKRQPGALSSAALEAMETAVGDPQTPCGSGAELRPIALAYLHGVVFAQHPLEKMGLRNNRELVTWCSLIDCLLRGEIASAMDVAAQRVGALEKSLVDNNWQVARWLELIPTSDAVLTTRTELRTAQRPDVLERIPPWRKKEGKDNSEED